jgi:hypothetical protein
MRADYLLIRTQTSIGSTSSYLFTGIAECTMSQVVDRPEHSDSNLHFSFQLRVGGCCYDCVLPTVAQRIVHVQRGACIRSHFLIELWLAFCQHVIVHKSRDKVCETEPCAG